jgi:hypothetical protein
MKFRAALAVGALLATAGATYADAASKPKPKPLFCHAMSDDKGDVVFAQADDHTAYEDEALDITSGDLGSNAKTITAAIRVVKLAVPASTSPATTYELRLSGPAGDVVYTLWVNLAASGNTAGVGKVDADPTGTDKAPETATSTGTATAFVDKAKSEIRISAPMSALSGLKPGQKVDIVDVIAKRTAPTQFYGRYADDGPGSKRYVLGTTSCVKVGG